VTAQTTAVSQDCRDPETRTNEVYEHSVLKSGSIGGDPVQGFVQLGAIELDLSRSDKLSAIAALTLGPLRARQPDLMISRRVGSGTGIVTALQLESETVADENERAKAGIVSGNPGRNDDQGYGRNDDGMPDAPRPFSLALRPNPT